MIKYKYIILFISFLFFSCSQEKTDSNIITLRGGVVAYTGSLVGYYTNGVKKYEQIYIDGSKNGAYKRWHSNGQLKTTGKYKKDCRIGLWKWLNLKAEDIYAMDYGHKS